MRNICLQQGPFLDYQGSSNWSVCFLARLFPSSLSESSLLVKEENYTREDSPPQSGDSTIWVSVPKTLNILCVSMNGFDIFDER